MKERQKKRLEVKGGRERRRNQPLDDLKEKKLKEEEDHSQWRAPFGWDYGPVVKTEYE
jgi:hypothetical protein